MSTIVIPFVAGSVITAKWGDKTQSYQVLVSCLSISLH